MPPQVLEMWTMMYGLVRTQVLHVAASLGLADLLAEKPMDTAALAEATGCHAESLARVLRCLVACEVLSRDADGRYALARLGEPLRSGMMAKAGSVFYGSGFIWDAWGNLLESVRTGKTAFEIAHGAPVFDYLAAHADDLRINTAFMTEMAGRRLDAAVGSFTFPESGLVVDVGGGNGVMLASILDSHPGLTGCLFELPEVAAQAERFLADAGLGDRCRVESGSFLEAVPAGGEVYVLSNILHDWDDEHCRRILHNCRRAMEPGAILVIIDAIMPEQQVPFTLAALDLQMMVVLGGKQRTESEFRALLEPAGFRVVRMTFAGLQCVAI
jgi:predicted O-methyltransferase YrrM